MVAATRFCIGSILLLITGCKSHQPVIDHKITCYRIVKGIAYFNVHNNSNAAIRVPIVNLDDRGYLINNYYRISGDTLYIRPVQTQDIHVSDGTPSKTLVLSGDCETLNPGESLQQGFVFNMNFTVITLTGYGNDISITACNPNLK